MSMFFTSKWRLGIVLAASALFCHPPAMASIELDNSQPCCSCDVSQPGCCGTCGALYEDCQCDPIGCYPSMPPCADGQCCYRNAHSYIYEGYAGRPGRTWGVWLPEGPPLYRPMVADPRQVCFGVGWRWNDQVLDKNIIPVTFGDNLALYQWGNVFFRCDELRIEVEGAVWATFAPLRESSPLMNADYYGAGVITYAIGDWAFRLRGYHISSHLGDEFLLNHPGFDRKNPSAEYIDLFASWEMTDDIRVYGGIGYIVHQDETFRNHRFYAEGGGEVRLFEMAWVRQCDKLYGVPFFGFFWRYSPDFKQHVDMTYALGYEFGKFCGLYRRLRLFVEYHDGYSVEGQFAHFPTNYLSINATYGF